MVSVPLTEDEAQRIIDAEKGIKGDVIWKYDQNHEGFAKAELIVDNDLGLDLRLHVTVNLTIPSRFSCNLTVSKAFGIRRLCMNKPHRNKHTDSNYLPGTHTHFWTNACRDRWAAERDQPNPEDLPEALRLFLADCGITFAGKIRGVPGLQQGF
ncbi:MAG: hypothetical protein WD379_03375 [Dehalococcoidia bacterium]